MYWEYAEKCFGVDWVEAFECIEDLLDTINFQGDKFSYESLSNEIIEYCQWIRSPKNQEKALKNIPSKLSSAIDELQNYHRVVVSSNQVSVWGIYLSCVISVMSKYRIKKSKTVVRNNVVENVTAEEQINNSKESAEQIFFRFIELPTIEKDTESSGVDLVRRIGKILIRILLAEDENSLSLFVRNTRVIARQAIFKLRYDKSISSGSVILDFYKSVLKFIGLVEGQQDSEESNAIALSQLLHYLSVGKMRSLTDEQIVDILKMTLNQTETKDQLMAFSELMRKARECGEYQLAYDVGMSWMSKKNLGIIESEALHIIPWDNMESNRKLFWMGTSKKMREKLYHEFFITCRQISGFFEPGSPEYSAFRLVSRNAGRNDKRSSALEIIIDDNSLAEGYLIKGQNSKAVNVLIDAIRTGKGFLSDKQPSKFYEVLLDSYFIMLAALFLKEKGNYGRWKQKAEVRDTIADMYKCLRYYGVCFRDGSSVDENGKQIYSIVYRRTIGLKSIKSHISKKTEILLNIILVDRLSELIGKSLQKHKYSNRVFFTRDKSKDENFFNHIAKSDEEAIAFYTTLRNASFLFEEMIIRDDGTLGKAEVGKEGKNCLTIMNERYMNDPYEGVALIKALGSNTLFGRKNPEYYRERLLEKKHFFLKSFTSRVDELLMWNRYASDYDLAGKNSNGCCIVLSNDTFDTILHASEEKIKDDYHLCKVLYVSNGGKLEKEYNKVDSDIVDSFYPRLRESVLRLDNLVKNEKDNKIVDAIEEDIVNTAFGKLLFLVKDKSYADEYESRMVLWRELDGKDIQVLSTVPPKLAIRPFFQVYISKIVLGPNTKNREEWKPYLQYNLERMWKKHSDGCQEDSNRWMIVESTIPYCTS